MSRLNWKRFGIDDVSIYDYVVGIDFGHRQTSCNYASIKGINGEFIIGQLQAAFIDANEHYICPTQFARTDKGIIIGQQAKRFQNVYIYFKRDPNKLNKLNKNNGKRGVPYPTDYSVTCRELVQEYVAELIQKIEQHNEDLKGKKILYLIGCPSGDVWFENDNDVEYANILKEKIDRDIVIMHESRASLIKLKNISQTTAKDIALTKKNEGVLVFDFGSSTADWTFMYIDENGVVRMIDATAMLGASLIDEEIMKLILEENGLTTDDLKELITAKIDTIEVKERVYENFKTGSYAEEDVRYKKKEDGRVYYDITTEVLKTVTSERKVSYSSTEGGATGTWEGLCEDFMVSARERIKKELAGIKLKKIMLTGGASQMYFIKDICMKVFGLNEDDIVLDDEPATCVSKGLVLAGQTDIEAQLASEKLIESLEEILDVTEIRKSISAVISDKLVEKSNVYSVIKGTMKEWASDAIADYSSQSTLNHLVNMFNDNGQDALKSAENIQLIIEGSNEAVESRVKEVKEKLSDTYNALYSTPIPDNLNINLSDKINDMTKVMNNLSLTLLSNPIVRPMMGFINGDNISFTAVRPLHTNGFGGLVLNAITGILQSRSEIVDNYMVSESQRKDAVITELRRVIYNGLLGSAEVSRLAKEIHEKILEAVDEVVDSMAMYAQK